MARDVDTLCTSVCKTGRCVVVHEATRFGGYGAELVAPPPALCTDNGAMIAWAGAERLALGLTDTLDFAPRARWPLDQVTKANLAPV